MDLVLNLITDLPDLIKGKLKLPQEYRDYVTLRIDCIFLELKRQINLVMIMKNDALIELMKKLKFGVLDDVLMALIFSDFIISISRRISSSVIYHPVSGWVSW